MAFVNRDLAPLPTQFTLTDREDGTLWGISHRASDNRIGINSTPLTGFNRFRQYYFPPYEGPVIKTNPRVRLLVRNGRLGFEEVVLPVGVTDMDQPRVQSFPRIALERYSLEIFDARPPHPQALPLVSAWTQVTSAWNPGWRVTDFGNPAEYLND